MLLCNTLKNYEVLYDALSGIMLQPDWICVKKLCLIGQNTRLTRKI